VQVRILVEGLVDEHERGVLGIREDVAVEMNLTVNILPVQTPLDRAEAPPVGNECYGTFLPDLMHFDGHVGRDSPPRLADHGLHPGESPRRRVVAVHEHPVLESGAGFPARRLLMNPLIGFLEPFPPLGDGVGNARHALSLGERATAPDLDVAAAGGGYSRRSEKLAHPALPSLKRPTIPPRMTSDL